MKNSVRLLTDLIEPTVEALGLELWGIEHIQRGKYSLLRIYIDSEQGVKIEDCEQVSRQVSAILDVEDPIANEYTLEVSSPGLDRPLFKREQFEKFAGSEIRLRLKSPLQGRRKFRGTLLKVDGDSICLRLEDQESWLPLADIEKANLVYQ